MTRKGNLSALQKIGAEVAKYFNSPQVLWVSLRDFAVANCARCKSGLLRDVEDFCFAVFDCLEPNVLREEREHRMIHVGALAVPLNLRIVDAGRRLTASYHHASTFGTIPAGVLGLTSLDVGLAAGERSK